MLVRQPPMSYKTNGQATDASRWLLPFNGVLPFPVRNYDSDKNTDSDHQ